MANFNLLARHLFSKNVFGQKGRFGNTEIIRRDFWGVLNAIFNRYDESRVKEVGPDRACAEWLIRCGAGVKWDRGADWFRDYNALPVSNDRSLKIVEVDGTDSAVMYNGFVHFRGVDHCRRMVFHKAGYFDDMCIIELTKYAKNLKELQISSCGNVSKEGILEIPKLIKLEKLLLYDLPDINNREELLKILTSALPRCQIKFPYALASERAAQEETKKDE